MLGGGATGNGDGGAGEGGEGGQPVGGTDGQRQEGQSFREVPGGDTFLTVASGAEDRVQGEIYTEYSQ